jgi:hypothetical protein
MSPEKKPLNFEEAEESFEKFAELADAIDKQDKIMQEEANKYLSQRVCPMLNKKCIQMECAWYIICLNRNIKAFKDYFQ